MTDEPSASDIGHRLRQIRHARRKSLAVIAGLAGISTSYLSRLESGARALDRRSLIAALANALEVAPSEITGPGVVSPGQLEEDRSLNAVRLALVAVSMNDPRGEVVPVEVLSSRANALFEAQRECRYAEVGAALPALIRDLHTTLAAGRGVEPVLRLLALTHVQGTQAWLMDIGANMDLGWHAVTLAQQAAARIDDPLSHAVSAFGTAFGLMGAGAFELAAQALSVPDLGTETNDAMEASGMLALTSSLVAAASGNEGQREAALENAADLAAHTGEGNALWFGFGPSNVGVWRMSVALEAGDHAEAARIATTVTPEALPSPTRRSAYWREYGRALAHLPRRHEDAVTMLRRAEQISPARIHRHPFMRSVLAELLTKAKRDSVGRELRGMAYRAGLPV
ncbi:Transcriptional regulator, contains XRE-family HTH domain [Lentzea xinjiangensis]|uniref:Transcriptional regulator, contains XRE-family HTH domain n=1 Tax=Lentzea xinjiangensis TaxID=402600 RepID=A0A1H9AER2_9PSEU|nr:helix-turn-helix domain-containing protein [Lentzea xinjiangensis]SEP74448.1 Transcriptional regulator, contains XRE-family HTH domain [Lentzea xinjiangensis]